MESTAVIKDSQKLKWEKRLQKVFDKMACKDPKKAIHKTALAAAGIVAIAPIGIDAWLLRLAEIMMLISIYSYYGVKISRGVAESLLSGAFCQFIGETAAIAALEAADAMTIATGGIGLPAQLGICTSIAVGLIEAVGWTTIKALEGNKLAAFAIQVENTIGGIADAKRLFGALTGASEAAAGQPMNSKTYSNALSFTGAAPTGKWGGKTLNQAISDGHSQPYGLDSVNKAQSRQNFQSAATLIFGTSTSSEAKTWINDQMIKEYGHC